MEKTEQRIRRLERARWFAPVPALIIYAATAGVFPDWLSIFLVLGFMFGFSAICSTEKKRMIREGITLDIRFVLTAVGQREAICEVKTIKIGMVVRVYLINAGNRTELCSRAIVKGISEGWYKRYVCATQIVDVARRSELKDAQLMLDNNLVDDMRKELEERRKRRKK